MKAPFIICGTVAVVVSWVGASAQSLADVAKKEEERRKAIKTPSKVYTEDDVRRHGDAMLPSPPVAVAEADAVPPTGVAGAAAGAEAEAQAAPAEAPDPVKDEAYWRGQMNELRTALERSQMHVEAMQSRINAITNDFYARDDPAQRALIERARQTALRELDRLKTEVVAQTTAIADLEEEARRAAVPPGWLR